MLDLSKRKTLDVMRTFIVISVLLMFLIQPVGNAYVGILEVGYQAKESNVRLAASTGMQVASMEDLREGEVR